MPFNFAAFEEECLSMSDAELAIQKKKYTRQASGSMGGAAASGFFLGPFVVFSLAAAAASSANAGAKLAIINNETSKPHRRRSSTRMRDVLGGFALSAGTAGLGHHVSYATNHLIAQHAGHALNHTQSAINGGIDSGLELTTHKSLEGALYKVERICDRCYTDIGDGSCHWHCTDCANYDLCRNCYSAHRDCHPSYHDFV
jgi:hypothetical protein